MALDLDDLLNRCCIGYSVYYPPFDAIDGQIRIFTYPGIGYNLSTLHAESGVFFLREWDLTLEEAKKVLPKYLRCLPDHVVSWVVIPETSLRLFVTRQSAEEYLNGEKDKHLLMRQVDFIPSSQPETNTRTKYTFSFSLD